MRLLPFLPKGNRETVVIRARIGRYFPALSKVWSKRPPLIVRNKNVVLGQKRQWWLLRRDTALAIGSASVGGLVHPSKLILEMLHLSEQDYSSPVSE
jgi:hypothetical protein